MEIVLFAGNVEEKNLEAAEEYLSLLWDAGVAKTEIERLRKSGAVVDRRVNDVVRAAGGAPWAWDDPGVRRELLKVLSGKKLHPPVLITRHDGLVIADGSHRVAFAYHVDPFMTIPVYVGS